MTLNVVAFPDRNVNDIPRLARQFADDIEASEYGAVHTVIVLALSDDELHSFGWGAADSKMKIVGILEAAKAQRIESFFEDGD